MGAQLKSQMQVLIISVSIQGFQHEILDVYIGHSTIRRCLLRRHAVLGQLRQAELG